MKTILFFCLAVLLLAPLSRADNASGVWNGDHYTNKTVLSGSINKILDKEKQDKISQGISEKYFTDHFDLSSVEDLNGSIEISFVFNIGEYNARVMNTTKLHEIRSLVARSDAERLLRKCIVEDYTAPSAVLNHDGTLMLLANTSNMRYNAAINLENGLCLLIDERYGTKKFIENSDIVAQNISNIDNGISRDFSPPTIFYFLVSAIILIGLVFFKRRKLFPLHR